MEEQNLGRNKAEKLLCLEYVDTYKKVIEYIPKVNADIKELNIVYRGMKKEIKVNGLENDNNDELENIKIKIKNKVKERNVLKGVELELLDIIMHMERYLPYKDRLYSKKQAEELSKQTFNKASNTGVILKEKLNVNSIEELVHNKILQDELLTMLKGLLTDKQYTCMYMYYYEKYTQEQIADKLGMTQQSVSLHISNSIDLIQRSDYLINLLNFLC